MTKESYRERRGIQFIDVFIQDIRYGFRVLLKNPAFALAGILILGLGIGSNTAIFSLVNAVILRPLPFRDSARIMRVWQTPPETFFMPAGNRRIFVVSTANYLDWDAQNHVFDRMAMYRFRPFNITGQGEPDVLRTAVVTGEFFNILGVQPLAGRTLGAADQAPDAPRVVLLRERVWRTRFGADPAAIGRSIALNGEPYTIVGVVPQRARFRERRPLAAARLDPEERTVRSNHTYFVIGHLRPGMDVKAAQAEMTTISQRLELRIRRTTRAGARSSCRFTRTSSATCACPPAPARRRGLRRPHRIGEPGKPPPRQDARAIARTGRAHRAGASRLRVIQQVLTETLLLAAGGTFLGLLAGGSACGCCPRRSPSSFPGWAKSISTPGSSSSRARSPSPRRCSPASCPPGASRAPTPTTP
jgi:hypothetical protein